jgi:hypothetical protein
MAGRRNAGYQTLLKNFVVERLYEEEKKEAVLPPGEMAPTQAARECATTKKRDRLDEVHEYIEENESLLEDPELDSITSSSLATLRHRTQRLPDGAGAPQRPPGLPDPPGGGADVPRGTRELRKTHLQPVERRLRTYARPVQVLLENSGPAHERGSQSMLPFLVNMTRLYELFVSEWLKAHLPDAISLRRRGPTWTERPASTST